MDVNTHYNAIMGKSWPGAIKEVASPFHQKLKFLLPEGIVEVRRDHEQS